ncbi:MAG: NAD+ synthase [Gammaproteobacteria bacterium]|jgi:NAD+ synthase (glutamine-hydrolysing)
MAASLKLVLAQLNPVVGDVAGNTRRVLAEAARARDDHGADLVVFPELFLCGYPPEDLLFHSGMRHQIAEALDNIRTGLSDVAVLVGFPEYDGERIYNAAVVLEQGRELARYRKHLLPNYRVFDEKRYFTPGDKPAVFRHRGTRIGLTICEDIWQAGPARLSRGAGAELVLTINGSPYDVASQEKRERAGRARASETGVPLVYLNMVGGQDELVFDGGSFVADAKGELTFRAPVFEEGLFPVTLDVGQRSIEPRPLPLAELPGLEESVYSALVLGTRDYVDKHGFPGVVIGLSGGIDSALTLAVAVDALGPERVQAVMMPYRYTSDISLTDAAAQAECLGVRYDVISIEPMVEATLGQLAPIFEGLSEDATEENIQSRCRGILLMALSNKTGRMVLTTGNKSEMAVGYATLYGDMAGGFAPLKDCSKTLVYRLARYRNSRSPAIPERVITREPSAELKPDQKDTDSLPPYDVLDPILAAFIEEDLSVDEIAARGYPRETVLKVLNMVRRSEYKRRQAPPGVRISTRAFGRDWRYPITSGYRFPG